MSAPDLTRWNRAGLKRLRYVDGNAATHYDLLREALRAQYGTWPPAPAPAGESEDERRTRLEAQYAAPTGDWGEELARVLARACHILTEYIDAYANEATLRTATQWDNARRLVGMLGYSPAPPASAATPLVILAKPGKRGRIAKGFSAKFSPAGGGAPIVFETLADLDVDDALNALRLAGHDRSSLAVDGTTLELADSIAGLKLGEPVVLENERTGYTLARIIAGLRETDGHTVLVFDAPIGRGAGLVRGTTLVHLKPADRLGVLGPAQSDATAAMLGDTLMLVAAPRALAVGDVVHIADGVHGYYRRVRAIDGARVRLDRALDGALRLDGAWMSRARRVSVAKVDAREARDGVSLFVFKAPGDLGGSVPDAIADVVMVGGAPQLRAFPVVTAKYQPPAPDNPAAGYTTFMVEDRDRLLDNPQAVYLPSATREWSLDSFLFDGGGAVLPATLATSLPKATSATDIAVVVSGARLAWARLTNVAPDTAAGRAELGVERWYARASGRFYLSQTRVYGGFAKRARLDGWDRNDDPIPVAPAGLPPEAALPELLVPGRNVWVEQEQPDGSFAAGRAASFLGAKDGAMLFDPPLSPSEGFTVGNTVIRGNVAGAAHGETQTERVLGSGDATALGQSFVLDVAGVSFVADATLPAGVRAAIDVLIDGRAWTQVGKLDDSGPGDAHYVVRMTEEGWLRIEFGDGTRGRRLPTGANNVRVRYRLGTGLAGNLPAGRLEKPARPHPLVDKIRQPIAATGGGDMEGVSALRRSAPASVLTLERAVSADDYARLAGSHSAVWRARAFALPSALRRPRLEVVVVPAGGAALDERLQSALRDFLLAHSLPGVDVQVQELDRVWLHLDVTLRIVSAEFDPPTVKAAAAARLTDAFALRQREIGAPLYLSDVLAVVENIPGVENSSVVLAWDRGGDAQPGGQRIDAAPREVVFLDVAARPGALRVELEEFEL